MPIRFSAMRRLYGLLSTTSALSCATFGRAGPGRPAAARRSLQHVRTDAAARSGGCQSAPDGNCLHDSLVRTWASSRSQASSRALSSATVRSLAGSMVAILSFLAGAAYLASSAVLPPVHSTGVQWQTFKGTQGRQAGLVFVVGLVLASSSSAARC